jgi:mono/diheme cytochrome c family protein
MNMAARFPLATVHRLRQALAICLFAIPVLAPAADPEPPVTLSSGWTFTEQDGEALYHASCQACHMAHGEGASGAGRYPPLAGNPRLGSAAYLIHNVLHGRNGMPAFAGYMSDQQVAAVVNYTRSHFGNRYPDTVTADDVRKLR